MKFPKSLKTLVDYQSILIKINIKSKLAKKLKMKVWSNHIE